VHQKVRFFSTPSLHSITPTTIQQEKSDKETQDLYQQSKLEVERLKEKNKSQADSIEKLRSECNELRNQTKEFERMKERSGMLKEILESTKEENQKLNQQVMLAKVEAGALNEKLAAKIESEEALKAAKIKLEENLQTTQAKRENLVVQLESSNVKLESKLEKLNSIETQNKELRKQVNELKLKISQQQTQIRVEQNIHQREQDKDQQKFHELQCQIQEKDMKISNLEGKMEITSLSLKQLQESFASMNEKDNMKGAMKLKNGLKSSPKPFLSNMYGTECTKQDLIEIIEAHVDQIEVLHQKNYMYKREIVKLQQKLKCVL